MMIDDIKPIPGLQRFHGRVYNRESEAFGTGSNGMDNAPTFFRCVKPKRDELGRIF